MSLNNDRKSSCEHNHGASHLIPDRIFKIGISLNLVFVLIELYFGWIHESLALISDAIHNLTDVIGLLMAWLGYALARKTKYKKVSIYAALLNAVLLVVSSVWVIREAYERYYSDHQPVALTMMAVAGIGVAINFATAKLFHRDHHHDLNIKAAYLHLMADAAISLAVVMAGAMIYFYSSYWVDPVLSAIVSVIIIVSAWSILREAVNMLRGRTPKTVNLDKLRQLLQEYGIDIPVQQLRVQALSTSENSLLLPPQQSLSPQQRHQLEHRLADDFKITQLEFQSDA